MVDALLFLLLFLGVPADVTALWFMTMGPSPQAIVMPVWCLRPESGSSRRFRRVPAIGG
jgi:hypothetical protein